MILPWKDYATSLAFSNPSQQQKQHHHAPFLHLFSILWKKLKLLKDCPWALFSSRREFLSLPTALSNTYIFWGGLHLHLQLTHVFRAQDLSNCALHMYLHECHTSLSNARLQNQTQPLLSAPNPTKNQNTKTQVYLPGRWFTLLVVKKPWTIIRNKVPGLVKP